MTELEPCPWCQSSGKNLIERVTEKENAGIMFCQAYIECWECGARGPQTSWYTTRDAALKWLRQGIEDEPCWNTRHPSSDARKEEREAVAAWLTPHVFGTAASWTAAAISRGDHIRALGEDHG